MEFIIPGRDLLLLPPLQFPVLSPQSSFYHCFCNGPVSRRPRAKHVGAVATVAVVAMVWSGQDKRTNAERCRHVVWESYPIFYHARTWNSYILEFRLLSQVLAKKCSRTHVFFRD